MHVQILLLINVVAHVAHCTVNDNLSLEFGTKNNDKDAKNYREFFYVLRPGELPTCEEESTYKAVIPKIKDKKITFKLTKHYQCHKYTFEDLDIPGHTDYSGILGGTYWYDIKKSNGRKVTAKLEYLSSQDGQLYSSEEGLSIESQMHSTRPDDIETPRIVKNYFLYEAGKEKLFVKLKLENPLEKNSRLFVKVLGPIIKDSNLKLRGVVWTMSCTKKDNECKRKNISIKKNQIARKILDQLNFVRKNKDVDNNDENKDKYPKVVMELFEQETPSYSVAAFQCNSDGQCSDVVQDTLKEIPKEDEVPV